MNPTDFMWEQLRRTVEGLTDNGMVPVATFAAVGPDPIIRVDAYREVDGTRQGRRLWTYYVHPQPTERALYLQHVQGDAPTLSPTAAEPQPSADVHESKPDEAP